MAFCHGCGQKVVDTWKYCEYCGATIDTYDGKQTNSGTKVELDLDDGVQFKSTSSNKEVTFADLPDFNLLLSNDELISNPVISTPIQPPKKQELPKKFQGQILENNYIRLEYVGHEKRGMKCALYFKATSKVNYDITAVITESNGQTQSNSGNIAVIKKGFNGKVITFEIFDTRSMLELNNSVTIILMGNVKVKNNNYERELADYRRRGSDPDEPKPDPVIIKTAFKSRFKLNSINPRFSTVKNMI